MWHKNKNHTLRNCKKYLAGVKALINKTIVGVGAAIISVGSLAGVNAYMWHRQGDMVDNYVKLKDEQNEIVRSINDMHVNILTAVHDKEKACAVLEATVSTAKHSHSYCREVK